MNDTLKFNKGEWSEAYAFIKLLADKKIYFADDNLDKQEKYLNILEIFYDDNSNRYVVDPKKDLIKIEDSNSNLIRTVTCSDLANCANTILNEISNSNSTTFEIPKLESFLYEIGNINFKGSSRKKSDIGLTLNLSNNLVKDYSFSIKSFLGNKPTLLNASKATNFRYVVNLSYENLNKLLSIEKGGRNWLKERMKKLDEFEKEGLCNISFIGMNSVIFENNLKFINNDLPILLSFILRYYYTNTGITNIKDLVNLLIDYNPLNIEKSKKVSFYKNNIVSLLKASAFGMTPTKEWNGEYDVDGGFIIVKKEGEVLCLRLFVNEYSLDEFLYNNTKLETASTSRYHQGELMEIGNGKYEFCLNLQIRFK